MSFKNTFGQAPAVDVFVPGRVNLIGEHVDYNGGNVLPTALSLGVRLSLRPRTDDILRIAADGFEALAQRQLGEPSRDHWSDYVLGALTLAGVKGADVFVTTDLPVGAGLSSSAAVCVAALRAVRPELSDVETVKLARQVETDYIGVPCGIMDQMAVALATPGQALSLDTRTLAHELIALPESHHFAVIHSGVTRKLNEGRYAERAAECAQIKTRLGREDICHASNAELEKIADSLLRRRARHVTTEHQRTVAAARALQVSDLRRFGALMNDSHLSMRDDFETSVPEVDALVATAQALGAVGARLTGGGFGGCIVACVSKPDYPVWKNKLLAAHPKSWSVC
jgi:galactokinase